MYTSAQSNKYQHSRIKDPNGLYSDINLATIKKSSMPKPTSEDLESNIDLILGHNA